MYKEIEFIIFTRALSKADIAARLGMTYNTFLLKLKGRYKFSLDEAVNLKKILETDIPIEALFSFEAKGA